MAALEPQYMEILKKALAECFVPFLPPLLDTTKPADQQQAKQVSRAFSAFALHKLLDITPQASGKRTARPTGRARCGGSCTGKA